MSHYISLCLTISHYISLYLTISLTIYHYVSLYLTISHYMSLYLTISHYISRCPTVSHYISLYRGLGLGFSLSLPLSLPLSLTLTLTLAWKCRIFTENVGYLQVWPPNMHIQSKPTSNLEPRGQVWVYRCLLSIHGVSREKSKLPPESRERRSGIRSNLFLAVTF